MSSPWGHTKSDIIEMSEHTVRKMRGRIKTITYERRSWERKREMQRERTCVKAHSVHTCMYRGLASCLIPCTPYTSCTSFLHKNSSLCYFHGIYEHSQMRKKNEKVIKVKPASNGSSPRRFNR